MNILAIDAGNTRIKWGLADAGGWVRRGAVMTAQAETLAASLEDLPPAHRIVVSNVAGAAVREAIEHAVAAGGVTPLWVVASAQQCGVRSSYVEPSQLGPDRWAGLIAAWKMFQGACVVVNAGTTMTVDALTAEGVFLGGCIVPGIDLMRAALDANTARLRQQEGAFYFFPDKTADAIMSGAINALAGTVERMAGYMEQTGQGVPLIVLAGGAAELIKPRLNAKVEQIDNLVLEGLLHIARDGG